MVLFVFVIMLLNAGTEEKLTVAAVGELRWAFRCCSLFIGVVGYIVIQRMLPESAPVRLRRIHARQRAGNRHEASSRSTCCRLKSPAY